MSDKIRIIESKQIESAVAELCVKANTEIGVDIRAALEKAMTVETLPLAQATLKTLLDNAEAASRERIPACQDTGMAVVFISLGRGVHIDGDIDEAINEGVRRGYREG